jgi:hypothetical protein
MDASRLRPSLVENRERRLAIVADRDRPPPDRAVAPSIDEKGQTSVQDCAPRRSRLRFGYSPNAVECDVPTREAIPAADGFVTCMQTDVLKSLADHLRWTFCLTPTSAT